MQMHEAFMGACFMPCVMITVSLCRRMPVPFGEEGKLFSALLLKTARVPAGIN